MLPGALGPLASSTIAWHYLADICGEYPQITTFEDIRVVNGVRKLMSTFTSALNVKTTEHQQHVSLSLIVLELC